MEIIVVVLELVRRFLQRVGPYVLVEILLPGGTLLALLLLLCRNGRFAAAHPATTALRAVPAVVQVLGACRAAHA